jgi:hypothetical protein
MTTYITRHFVPTWLGITIGNGDNIGRHITDTRNNNTWRQAHFTLGTTSAITGPIALDVPYWGPSICDLFDASTGIFYRTLIDVSGWPCPLSPTVPFVWSAGDYIDIKIYCPPEHLEVGTRWATA